jgi:glucose-6-phosphate 1-epimerase
LQELNDKFGVQGQVRFVAGHGGLPLAQLRTAEAEAHVYLHGGHVAHYQRAGEEPLLFMSEKSWFEDGKPIRGGVPVCFPWFGPCKSPIGDPAESPAHGLVRLTEWDVEAVGEDPAGRMAITLLTRDTPRTRKAWPHAFELRHRITIDRQLHMDLEVRNTGDKAFTFEEALHTYFAVDDIRHVQVIGLEGCDYLDKVATGKQKQGDHPITFAAETDRVYDGASGPCMIVDGAAGRHIAVEKSDSHTTVVWNPWIAKAAAMPDFGDDEWQRMVCVETANAFDHAVTLAPGARHTMRAMVG